MSQGAISREEVSGAIADLIRNRLDVIDALEQGAQRRSEKQESFPSQVRMVEEGIHASLKLADDLGLYEDVHSQVPLPQNIKDTYWGSGHPHAQR